MSNIVHMPFSEWFLSTYTISAFMDVPVPRLLSFPSLNSNTGLSFNMKGEKVCTEALKSSKLKFTDDFIIHLMHTSSSAWHSGRVIRTPHADPQAFSASTIRALSLSLCMQIFQLNSPNVLC